MKPHFEPPNPDGLRSRNRNPRWQPGEEPGFRENLRQVDTPSPDLDPGRELRLASASRRVVIVPQRRQTSSPSRHWLGRIQILPVIYIAGLSLLGYTFATRSISAFSSAWRSTDTSVVAEEMRPSQPPSGETPAPSGPFGAVTSGSGVLQGLLPLFSKAGSSGDNPAATAPPGSPGTFE